MRAADQRHGLRRALHLPQEEAGSVSCSVSCPISGPVSFHSWRSCCRSPSASSGRLAAGRSGCAAKPASRVRKQPARRSAVVRIEKVGVVLDHAAEHLVAAGERTGGASGRTWPLRSRRRRPTSTPAMGGGAAALSRVKKTWKKARRRDCDPAAAPRPASRTAGPGAPWRRERHLAHPRQQFAVAPLNLDGDQQSDLTVHGGLDKAIYAYPAEHYQFWRQEFPKFDFQWGSLGENFTTEGLFEHSTKIGDRLAIGSAEFVVTQPRMPCYKLGIRLGDKQAIKTLLQSRKTGFYLAVTKEGIVTAGDPIRLISRKRIACR